MVGRKKVERGFQKLANLSIVGGEVGQFYQLWELGKFGTANSVNYGKLEKVGRDRRKRNHEILVEMRGVCVIE